MNSAVKVKNVSVTLGHVEAVKKLSVDIKTGIVTGFIGPSGAGKTTLIRAIVGRQSFKSGSIMVFGRPAGNAELRTELSYMTQELSVYPDLTVMENLRYFATMAGQSGKEVGPMLKEILVEVDMLPKADALVRNLSGGQKQRVSLAVALIGSPRLMVLDEPTVGLDPVLRNNLWRLFSKLAKAGSTVIVSSHSMDEAGRCDDLILMREGKLIAQGSPSALRKMTKTDTIEATFLKLAGSSK
jgi:ABC-2 type transport system ATP-binding protein